MKLSILSIFIFIYISVQKTTNPVWITIEVLEKELDLKNTLWSKWRLWSPSLPSWQNLGLHQFTWLQVTCDCFKKSNKFLRIFKERCRFFPGFKKKEFGKIIQFLFYFLNLWIIFYSYTEAWNNVWSNQLLDPTRYEIHCVQSHQRNRGNLCVHCKSCFKHGISGKIFLSVRYENKAS